MNLNRFFLGEDSLVSIETTETVDEIKSKLASKYQWSDIDPERLELYQRQEFYGDGLVYYVKDKWLKIYFSKDLNWRWRINGGAYLFRFAGQIIDNGQTSKIIGLIELPLLWYILSFTFLGVFTFMFIGWLVAGESMFRDGEYLVIFVIFSLLNITITLARSRTRVSEMRDKLYQMFPK